MDVLPTLKTSTVTQKGQVTLPAPLRNKLDIKPGTKVLFEAEGDYIKLRTVKYSLESAFASVGPLKKKLSLKEIRRIALEDKILKDKTNETR